MSSTAKADVSRTVPHWQCGTCANQPDNDAAVADPADQNVSTADEPVILTLSLRIGKKIDVRGHASLRAGVVETLCAGEWKGIADIASDGTFQNADLPSSYLIENQIYVRVRHAQSISQPLTATDGFVHPRSVLIHPTATKQDDQKFYHWRLQWADYQPCGYQVEANTLFSIWVVGDVDQGTICIGTQGIAEKRDRTRQTQNMRELPLKSGENIFNGGPEGGVLHFRNNGKAGFRVLLGPQTRPIPYFILGQTPVEDWQRMLTQSDELSQIELVGDRVVITAYADTYHRYKPGTPGDIVHSHETVLAIEAQAAGLNGSSPKHTRSNMWIYAVEAASTVVPSAATGYIALPHRTDPNNEYMRALIGGEAHRRWVTLHEYGHHFQTPMNSVAPLFDEVSVNMYAIAVALQFKNDYTEDMRQRWPQIKAWLAKPREQKRYEESPDRFALLEQLRRVYGSYVFTRWDREMRQNPPAQNDLTSLACSLSLAARYNLAGFFADWGVITEGDETWQALHLLGMYKAQSGLKDLPPYSDLSDA